MDHFTKIGLEYEVVNESVRHSVAVTVDVSHRLSKSLVKEWVRDGSLSYDGVEMVTQPIPYDSHLMSKLRLIQDTFIDFGFWTDSSCGLHVHYDASNLRTPSLIKIWELYSYAQCYLMCLVAKNRWGNEYCTWIPPYDSNRSFLDNLFNESYSRKRHRFSYKYDRTHHWLISFSDYYFNRMKTIEVRAHEGTIRAKPIYDWIKLNRNLMLFALSRKFKPRFYEVAEFADIASGGDVRLRKSIELKLGRREAMVFKRVRPLPQEGLGELYV